MIQTKSQFEKYSKLGGFLLFFVFICIFSIIMNIVNYNNVIETINYVRDAGVEGADSAFLFIHINLFLSISICLALLYLVWKRSDAKKIRILLIFTLISSLFLEYFLYSSLSTLINNLNVGSVSLVQDAIKDVIRSISFSVAWFFYFLYSERVKVYTRKSSEPTELQ